MKIAIFPGSFDPFTAGHEDIARRGLLLFDKIVIAVGFNIDKRGLLDVKSRTKLIEDTFENESRIEVISYQGLTVDLCRQHGVHFLLRGVRSSVDFEYERGIDNVNRLLCPGIESVLLMTDPHNAVISSSIVRELVRHGGDTSKFMPKGVRLEEYIK